MQEQDPINPSHYKEGDVECIEAIKSSLDTNAFHGYLKASVMKYLWRYDKKDNPALCLGKAQWFMNRLVNEHNQSVEDDLWTMAQVEADAESKPVEF
jgi:hypothetical protein|tara:strand:+ start:2861 stop:3151 length:291 start_codon:yes stop_codon:yes gene_type:complete